MRTRPRSAAAGDRARRRHRRRVADRRRRAGLRCARRRGAGSLGRGAPARSRRQPQADAGRAGLRRHRACCCGWRRSRGPRPRRRDGSCARRIRRLPPAWSAWGAPVFDAQLVRNRHGPVGRWIMEWKCDECLFSEPAAYPQPVAATPAHRPHQARKALSDEAREQNSRDTTGALPLPLAGEGWGGGVAASQTVRVERAPTRIASNDAIRPSTRKRER